jgi:hypothetical protein
MKVTTIKPGILLLDDDAARYVRGKGYEPVEGQKWKRYSWATCKLDLTKDYTDHKSRAELIVKMLRHFDAA